MGVFRSEEFVKKRIRIPRESIAEILNALGKLDDCLEFIDLNKDNIEAKKNFASMIKRCEEMEKKIFVFERKCQEYGLQFYTYKSYNNFLTDIETDQNNRDERISGSTYFDLIENEIVEDERRLFELIDSYNQIEETLDSLHERREVMIKTMQLLVSHDTFRSSGGVNVNNHMIEDFNQMNRDLNNPMLLDTHLEEGRRSGLDFLAGIIKADDEIRMKRMIFRISKGRAISTFWDLDESNRYIQNEKRKELKKKIFAVFFQGGVENVLGAKILKICDIFNASRYHIPKPEEINNVVASINNEIREKQCFLKEAESSISNFISIKSGDDKQSGKYPMYKLYFKKEKLIYININKCILRETFIDGELWIPTKKLHLVQHTLWNLFKGNDDRLTANLIDVPIDYEFENPPTYIPSNEFLWAFQEIVDTYGVPRYQEINPAYFNIVTFPFLFGVMFGDIGHGFILLMFALYLCLFNSNIESDKTNMLRGMLKGRYILLLMGFFAFYCGWLYNDFFSVPVDFGSCYENNHHTNTAIKKENCVYPFGLDPKWYVSTNELTFFNSLKMKLSVIFGVIHMLFGIFLRGLNALYFKNISDFLWQFIPQFIFMSVLFGYMDFMIYIKWATNWDGRRLDAPNLISTLMNIFLKLGSVLNKPLWGGQLSNGSYVQEWVQRGILAIALLCIPLMLFVKPILESFKTKRKIYYSVSHIEQSDDIRELPSHLSDSKGQPEKHSFGEIFIHQVIETIEFVLGAVSNTASYLRLWALSLAHGQLSKVFFEKTISTGLANENVVLGTITLFIAYFFFANVTFFVLMCMDMMECFLHTLRLHWVEFQNKFYKADGYKFNPYCFKYIIITE